MLDIGDALIHVFIVVTTIHLTIEAIRNIRDIEEGREVFRLWYYFMAIFGWGLVYSHRMLW